MSHKFEDTQIAAHQPNGSTRADLFGDTLLAGNGGTPGNGVSEHSLYGDELYVAHNGPAPVNWGDGPDGVDRRRSVDADDVEILAIKGVALAVQPRAGL
ncbi:MAG: hypothetical protein ACR2PO_07115 [Methyloligellaceae bacterium]